MTLGYAFPPPPRASLPVVGSELHFPVHRIYCVGRNYAEHTREMGGDPERSPPFFFSKPADALVANGSTIPFPLATQDLHHEIELVVALKSGGTEIAVEDALTHVFGYATGIDLTRRDLQQEAKDLRRPWDASKGFDRAAPCTALAPVETAGHPDKGAISLSVNGELRQAGDLAEMIWSVPEIICHLSGLFELQAGDLIFTGTPAGVGPVRRGDRLEGRIEGLEVLGVGFEA